MQKTKIIILALGVLALSAGCNFSSLTGTGVLGVVKTIDGGGSWQTSNALENSKNDISGQTVTEMAFDPTNRQTIFLSTLNNGLLRSDNAAQTWRQILSKVTAYDFYIDPSDTQHIYVAGIYNGHGKILRTNDGGSSWEETYNEATSNNAVNSVVANPTNSQEVYAGLSSGVMIKSIDGGVNWFVLQNFKDQILRIRYVNNAIYVLMQNKGIAISTDSGVNFTPITNALTHTDFYNGDNLLPVTQVGFIRMSLDDKTAGVIYVTTYGGLYKTTDNGKHWNLLNLPLALKDQQPFAVASTQGGAIAYTSVGSTVYKTLDGGQSWQTQALPTTNIVNKILIDPQLPQITYAGLKLK